MAEQKTSRLKAEWHEIEPAVFERKGFSPEEAERLNRRPNDLIKSALRGATKSPDEKNNGR
jgi:hypothetical protein